MSTPTWTATQRARARIKAPALYDAAGRAKDLLEAIANEPVASEAKVLRSEIDHVTADITDIINEIDTGVSDG